MVKKQEETITSRKKLAQILQSAGGIVKENGKLLLVDFKSAIEIIGKNTGDHLKISPTNTINLKNFGCQIGHGIFKEGICIMPISH